MKYHVYVAAGNSILQVNLESDSGPQRDGKQLLLGESQFKFSDVMAVVPDDARKGDRLIVAGRG